MLFNFKNLIQLSSRVSRKCELQAIFFKEVVRNDLKCILPKNLNQNFHTDMPRNKYSDELEFRRAQKEAVGKINIKEPVEEDLAKKRKEDYFPTDDLPDTLFNGIPFKMVPIINIKVSRNNTIMSLSDKGVVKLSKSCGTEGFKNARKGTNIAAQATGTSFGMRAIKKGYKTVRVILKGLGPGRLSSIKGLQLGGVNVISVTDNTIDFTTQRPRKQRRL